MAAPRDNDDIAAALHGLSEGASDSTAGHAQPAPQQNVRQPAPAPPPKKSARPAAPAARPAAPAPRPPSAAPRPTAPAPAKPASGTSTGRARPAAPPTPSDAEFERVEDDDRGSGEEAAIAATAAMDYHNPRTTPARPRRTPYFKTLAFRQMMIPVMLTTGVMMIVMAVAQHVVDEDAPLARLPGWTGIALVACAAALVGLAVLNMMLVRNELATKAPR
jgi:hypothetical protein